MRFMLLLASLLAFALPVHAAKGHVHGEGGLDVVIEKDAITLTLELPLDAATGFERAPKTDKERAALAATEAALKNPELFLPTPAARCTAQPPQVAMPAFDGKQGDGGHGDIDATYSFRCAVPAALKSIETTLFRSFKRLYRLEARRVGPAGQGAARLTPKNPVLNW
jgi:hypothetical protein